ncbi:MAG TPA: hypothetical protein DIU39_06700 [Flavobacteriales bacterium]|nr:hypothetical protein [Flavobacteriales bacterium]
MRIALRNIVITIFTLVASNTFGQCVDSVYSNILNDFCNNQLNANLFENECTGLKFDQRFQVIVNIDSTLWTVEPFIIRNYLDSSLTRGITNKMDSKTWNWIVDQKRIKNLKINLSKFSKLEKTHLVKAPIETDSKKYLLRLSSPKTWGNYSYIELWVKYKYHNSGTRLLYRIDNSGKIVEVKKYNLCDDNG